MPVLAMMKWMRTLSRCRRTARLAMAGAALPFALAPVACTPVDARPDYARTRQLVDDRVGADDVFDPGDPAAAAARVDALLADGLTVDEAVRIALLNNRDFQVTLAEIGVSRADFVQSTLWTNPTLALGFNLPEGGGVADFTLGFTQQIADLWQIPVRRRMTARQLERTIAQAARQALELTAQVRTQCYDTLALRRAADLADQNARLAERIAGAARKQFDAGQVSEYDVNLTRASLLDIRAELINTRAQLQKSQTTLTDQLGLARAPQAVQLVDELPDAPADLATDGVLLACALDRRLDARAAELDARAAEDNLALECRRVFPDVQLGLAFERNEKRAMPGRKIAADTARSSLEAGRLTAPSIESRGQRGLARSQIIDAKLGPSLALTLPLWDQNQAQIAKARFRALQARTRYAQTLDTIARQVNETLIEARRTEELVQLYRNDSVPIAEATVKGATQLYEAGEQNALALVDAQEKLVTRQRELVNALRDRAIALANLELAVGGRLPQANPQPKEHDDESEKPDRPQDD